MSGAIPDESAKNAKRVVSGEGADIAERVVPPEGADDSERVEKLEGAEKTERVKKPESIARHERATVDESAEARKRAAVGPESAEATERAVVEPESAEHSEPPRHKLGYPQVHNATHHLWDAQQAGWPDHLPHQAWRAMAYRQTRDDFQRVSSADHPAFAAGYVPNPQATREVEVVADTAHTPAKARR